MSNPEWDITPGSTWKPLTDLKKTDIVRLYDALAQSSTREEREAVLRRMIHYPPEYETVYATLIARVNRIFEAAKDDNDCLHKTKCHKYKEFKHVLNEFQGGLFTDSGKPLRLTLKRTPRPSTPRPTTPRPTTPRPTTTTTTTTPSPSPSLFLHYNPDPLPIGRNTYMLNIPDFKLRMFAIMILDRTTDIERKEFIEKYMVIKYENDDSGIPMPADVETLDNVISTILSKLRGNASTQIKTQMLLDYLKRLKNFTLDPALIYVLYPFQDPNPTDLRNIPDVKLRMFAEMILERNTDEERTKFIKKYVHVTDADGEPFPGLLHDIILDILNTSNRETTESKIKNIFVHLLHLKNTTYPEVIRILYPFPVMYPSARRNPSVRRGGGGKRRRRTKKARKLI